MTWLFSSCQLWVGSDREIQCPEVMWTPITILAKMISSYNPRPTAEVLATSASLFMKLERLCLLFEKQSQFPSALWRHSILFRGRGKSTQGECACVWRGAQFLSPNSQYGNLRLLLFKSAATFFVSRGSQNSALGLNWGQLVFSQKNIEVFTSQNCIWLLWLAPLGERHQINF